MTSSNSLPTVDGLIRTLDLRPHPEGGYFRETYRTATRIPGERAASTLIYLLLPQGHVSRLHRVDADESWHLYLGGPLEVFELDERDPDAAPRCSRSFPPRGTWTCASRDCPMKPRIPPLSLAEAGPATLEPQPCERPTNSSIDARSPMSPGSI
jgi:hypothetical protein